MRKTVAALLLVWSISFAPSAKAAPALADRIPADAIMYIGWAGSQSLSAQYDTSHLKAIVDASEMGKLLTDFLPQLIHRVAKDDQDAADIMKQVIQLGGPIWNHPAAIYFGGIDFTGPTPTPRFALLSDAGNDAAKVSDLITKLIDKMPKDQGPLPHVKTYGSMVVLACGTTASIDADFAQAPARSLMTAPQFVSALDQVQHDAAVVEYINVKGLVDLINDSVQKNAPGQPYEKWQHIRDTLNLQGVHDSIVTMGFEGKDWGTAAFVSTSDDSNGIVSLFHGAPLSKELLSTVPKTANRVFAGECDIDAIFGHVRDIVAQIDAGTADQVDDAIANINQAAGLDIRRDFLASLGTEWCLYSDVAVGGPSLLGSVVVNRLHDAAAADKALSTLADKANNVIAQLMKQPEIKIEFHESEANGVTVHYLAVPFVTPSWAVKDGNLYLGLYPQVVSAAVDQVSRKAPTILERPEFTALMKQLGDHPASSIEFSDLPVTAPQDYAELLMVSRLYLGFADIYGVQVPTYVVPLLSKIMPELSPSGGVSWSDSTGFHARTICPFPGSEILAGSIMGSGALGEQAIMVSILLPSMNKARETANRAKCASNEHQIGLALLLYENDNAGKLPDDLGTLLKTEQLGAAVFLCPSGNTSLPANFSTLPIDDQVKWINDNSDYVYLGKGLDSKNIPAEKIMVYEKDGAHENDGMNLLYGDGHAEWQPQAAAMKLIEDQRTLVKTIK